MNRRILSLLYLVWGTVAVVGFAAFFESWPQPLPKLLPVALPFYLATLTLLIFVHPLICLVTLVRKRRQGGDTKPVAVHLAWSVAITALFVGMVLNGFMITA